MRAAVFVLVLLVGIVAVGLRLDSVDQPEDDGAPGAHTVAAGAFALGTGTPDAVRVRIEGSTLWQAYLGARKATGAKPLTVSGSARSDWTARQVQVTLRVSDDRRDLLEKTMESAVPKRRLMWRGITIATFEPRESDYDRVTAAVIAEIVRVSAAQMIGGDAERGPGLSPQLVEAVCQETRRRSEFTSTAGLPVVKYSPLHAAAIAALAKLAHGDRRPVDAVVQRLPDPDAGLRRALCATLATMKSDAASAVPALVPRLKDDDDGVRDQAIGALHAIGPAATAAIAPLVELIAEPAHGSSALGAVESIAVSKDLVAPELASAVPRIATITEAPEKETCRLAALLLERIGAAAAPATPALAKMLTAPDVSGRELAARALARIGPGAAAAVPALTKALADESGVVAPEAVRALAAIGPGAKEAVSALSAALASPREPLASGAARALGAVGEAARPAAPELARALGSQHPELRQNAAEALERVGPTPEHVDALAKLVEDTVAGVRLAAIHALAAMPDAVLAPAVPRLAALGGTYQHHGTEARLAAIQLLARIRPLSKDALTALEAASTDRDEAVAEAALDALVAVAPLAGPRLLGRLADALIKARPETRTAAVAALVQAGEPGALAAVDLVSRGVRNADAARLVLAKASAPARRAAAGRLATIGERGDQQTRSYVIGLLAELGPDGAPAAPWLMTTLGDSGLRVQAARALQGAGPGATRYFVDAMKSASEPVQIQLVHLLGDAPGADAGTIDALVAALKRWKTAPHAIEALGKKGPAAARAAPALLDAIAVAGGMSEPDVGAAIGKMGPAAVPALIEGLNYTDSHARAASAEALAHIGRPAQAALSALQARLAVEKSDYVKRQIDRAIQAVR